MAANWQSEALEQAELLSNRVRQLASSGLHFLQNEFGIDLGLNPDTVPSWLILGTASVGIIVALVVAWVAACGGGGRIKREAVAREKSVNVNVNANVSVIDAAKAPLTKTVKTDEPTKKRNRKKPSDKQKAQPNGRTVAEPQEEVKVIQEVPKEPPPQPQIQPPADAKAEKAKKNKKKLKTEVKQSQGVASANGKEPDEGAWETKVSNREKRQQRKKEKGPNDDSGSPGGGDRVRQQVEQPKVTAPVSTKKNKEPAPKAGKSDAIVAPAVAQPSWTAPSSVNRGGWTDVSVKLPPQVSASESEKWSIGMKKTGHRNSEPMTWVQEPEAGSWAGVDGRIKPELNAVKFSILGLNQSGGDAVTQSAAELSKHYSLPTVDSEWSGFNGLGAVDPSSDWNAPTELWGNYEEPKAEKPAAQERTLAQPQKESDDDKEKADPSGASKSKRRKKKKKKPEDENAVSQVNTEGVRAPAESSNIKPRPRVATEEPAKQNTAPAPPQKKSDQNWEPPKQVQKKKARRET